jgi:hypothetical protein
MRYIKKITDKKKLIFIAYSTPYIHFRNYCGTMWVWKGSKRDTWNKENIDVKTWYLVQRNPWKIIILYVNAWKSNLLLSVKTNQSPYSDASLRQNLICDSTFLLLHPVFRRLFTLEFNQSSDILNWITVWNNMITILSVNINIEWSYEEGKFKSCL